MAHRAFFYALAEIAKRRAETRPKIAEVCIARLAEILDMVEASNPSSRDRMLSVCVSAMRTLDATGSNDSQSRAVLERYLQLPTTMEFYFRIGAVQWKARQVLKKMSCAPSHQSNDACCDTHATTPQQDITSNGAGAVAAKAGVAATTEGLVHKEDSDCDVEKALQLSN